MNLTMLKSFLSFGANPDRFNRFSICTHQDFVRSHCGKHPVVYLDLKNCRGETWNEMYQNIWMSVRIMVNRHKQELSKAQKRPNDYE
jgi:hypothetical protein